MIYLDNNASTIIYPEVIEKMTEIMRCNANASAPHQAGRKLRTELENARVSVSHLLGADATQVVFTSGATESNNMALLGGGETLALVSGVEHAAILNVHPNTECIPVDSGGIIDCDWLDNRLTDEPAGTVIVSVQFASHETGVIQPIKDVARIVAKRLQRLHVDAVQGAGKMPVNFSTMGAHSVSIAGHKIGAGQGIGALIYDMALNLKPMILGAGQERSQRSGTVNVAGAVGLGIAAQKCLATMTEKQQRIQDLQTHLETTLQHRYPDIVIAGQDSPRLCGTSRIMHKGMETEKQIMALDLAGVCVSAGAACSSGVTKVSKTLQAMGYDDELSSCSIRIGIGWATTRQDIDGFLDAYSAIVKMMGR